MSQLREYIEKHPSQTQRLIGVDYAQLIELIKQAENLHNKKQQVVEQKKTKLIKGGGGRQQKLNLSNPFLLRLYHFSKNMQQ